MSARLRVVTSDLPGCAGREVALGERPVEIGRADDCVLSLNDPRISRRHARVEREGGGHAVVDQGSANGIFAGESRVERLSLTPGMRFRIAGTVFEYEGASLADAAAPELVVRVVARAGGSKGGAAVGREFRVTGGAAVIGRPDLHVHDCRHHANTLAASPGASTRELMSRLGRLRSGHGGDHRVDHGRRRCWSQGP